ncbi:MAG: hypothetical protein F6K26_32810 [Moorea sp. SIO2I5]|nr:hypothetical protein [Moorena sp. SIO2I5]
MANLITGQAHHYGLGEAAPTCGGFPHEQLPWFPPVPLLHRFLMPHTPHPVPLHPTPEVKVKNLPL